jgi:hypothetical protein
VQDSPGTFRTCSAVLFVEFLLFREKTKKEKKTEEATLQAGQ